MLSAFACIRVIVVPATANHQHARTVTGHPAGGAITRAPPSGEREVELDNFCHTPKSTE